MQTIVLDASQWHTWKDFYNYLLAAIGAPDWHGRNVNALVDSMIWGGINAMQPPYIVKIVGTSNLPPDALDEVKLAAHGLAKAREDFRTLRGEDMDVSLELCP